MTNTMEKNEIIKLVIEGLLKQRNDLNYEMVNINYNEPTFSMKKSDLSMEINSIDINISNYIMNCVVNECKCKK